MVSQPVFCAAAWSGVTGVWGRLWSVGPGQEWCGRSGHGDPRLEGGKGVVHDDDSNNFYDHEILTNVSMRSPVATVPPKKYNVGS